MEDHRPGQWKQKNKPHKTGRHRSKGAIDNATKGKVSIKRFTRKHKEEQRREQRRNQMGQLRKNKREEALNIKRQLGGQNTAPFLVCILPMHKKIDANSALAILTGCDAEAVVEKSKSGVTYVNMPRYKQRFAFIVPPIGLGNALTVLDYLKVADTTLMLTSAAMGEDEVFDDWGEKIFKMISAQGIPAPIVALMDLLSINPKRRISAKAAAQKFIQKRLPDEKLVQLDTNDEGLNMLRRIGNQKHNILHNKENRPHLFADVVEYLPTSNEMGTLKVSGFLRGTPLDVNGLVHIPGLGDFQMSHIESPGDPYRLNKEALPIMAEVLAKADAVKQQSLQTENIPDAMDAEQTWPTEEEIELSRKENKQMKNIKLVPKGWSSYQAAWIPDTQEKLEEDDEEEDDDDEDDEANEMLCDNSEQAEQENFDDADGDESEEYFEATEMADPSGVDDEKYDMEMDFVEERETLKKLQAARENEQWADEIDTPLDVEARVRFQKYRGLESFHKSPWDPQENLPSDYARIYKFKNFNRTKRRIIAEAKDIDDGVQVNQAMSIYTSKLI